MRKKLPLKKLSLKNRQTLVQKRLFFFLLVIVLVLGMLTIVKAKGLLIPAQPKVPVAGNVVSLDSLSLEQKIAQMVITTGGNHNLQAWKRLQVGGLHFFARQTPQLYTNTIELFQQGMSIPFFITGDLEGCQNPFQEFYNSTPNSEITTVGDAYQKGSDDGKKLQELGFTINFAPVVDLHDEIWGCRSFPGDENTVAELAEAYVLGLQQQGVIATAKHYPGKTLVVRDPHKFLVSATIDPEDIIPYEHLVQRTPLKAVMVSHITASGAIDSENIPSVVSTQVIGGLKQNFSGLIISDEINMLGLKSFYPTVDEMYIAVFKAGNDLVLNFNEDPNEVYRMIQVVAEAVEQGEIPEEQIDASVTKILQAKGLVVLRE